MSIENGERMIRMLKENETLRSAIKERGQTEFETVSAEAGASATAFDVVAAFIRSIENDEYLK